MNIISLLDELQALARTGLHFANNEYDRVRYERLLTLATQPYADWLELPAADIQARFAQEVGCITPKLGADAAIFNEQGEILLMERVDGSGWCLPCGWVEVGERPIDAAVREVREETGLEVVVKQLVGVFTRPAGPQNGPHAMVAVVHLCEIVAGELRLSHEGTALRYWPIEAVSHWHPNHDKYARVAYEMWRSERLLAAVSD
ncbi:MAG: NUDIX hydrolase N-terminal domain-containing protein [Chloroflexota bacterium]